MATPHGLNSRGAYPVYDTSGNIGLFAKTLANQQAKRQQEEKLLQDELGKVKVEGVRQADLPEFTQRYNQWKDSYGKLQGERDPAKKMLLRRDFDKTQQELLQIADDSRKLAKGEDEFGKMLLNPNIRDRYKEDAVTQFQKSRNLSRNDPNFVRDLSKLQHQIDLSKIMQDLDKEDAEVMSISRFNDPTERVHTQGNRKGVLIEQSRNIDPSQQALRYANKFDLDPTFRVAVRELYPDLAELPNEKLKEAVVPRLVAERQRTEYKPQIFKEDVKPDDWKEKADYREGLIRGRPSKGGSGGGIDAPQDMTLYYGEDGKEAVTSRGTVKLGKTGQPMQGSVVYDLSGNKFEPIKESASKYEMVSIGNYPLAKAQLRLPDGKIIPKGGLVGDNFAKGRPDLVSWQPRLLVTADGYQYLADPKVLPKNKLTKKEEAILATFKPYSPQGSQSAPKQQVKSTVPKVGTTEGGYRFKGGNPADPKNWEKVK